MSTVTLQDVEQLSYIFQTHMAKETFPEEQYLLEQLFFRTQRILD
jgi:hypothetical protein